MRNPLLAFGCYAVGGHSWSHTYINWQRQEERKCRWCDKVQTRPQPW